jgi:FkbM family methyltransferase
MILKKIIKFIYSNLIPNYLKLVLFSLIKKKIKLNDKFTKHLLFKGFFKLSYKEKNIYLYSLPTIIENDIFWNGLENAKHEPMSYGIFHYFSSKSNCIIDGGSNTGIYSCIAHLANNKAKIHSFEPSKEFTYALNKIKDKNKMSLFINQVAIGNSNCEVYFDGLYKVSLDNSKEKSIPTKMIKLSEYIDANIEKLDLIKLDIEGFEMDVLKDIHLTLKKDLPVIIFEIWNNELTNKDILKNRLDFENLIKSLNYKIYCIDDVNKKIIKKKYITSSKTLKNRTFENFLLINQKDEQNFIKNFKNNLDK